MLFYRGRIDFQIKFNGYRIELEEINFYLSKNEYVRYGVAAPKYNKDHTVKQIVAEIELKHGVARQHSEATLTKAIREDLAKNIMPYMLPQRLSTKTSCLFLKTARLISRRLLRRLISSEF